MFLPSSFLSDSNILNLGGAIPGQLFFFLGGTWLQPASLPLVPPQQLPAPPAQQKEEVGKGKDVAKWGEGRRFMRSTQPPDRQLNASHGQGNFWGQGVKSLAAPLLHWTEHLTITL